MVNAPLVTRCSARVTCSVAGLGNSEKMSAVAVWLHSAHHRRGLAMRFGNLSHIIHHPVRDAIQQLTTAIGQTIRVFGFYAVLAI